MTSKQIAIEVLGKISASFPNYFENAKAAAEILLSGIDIKEDLNIVNSICFSWMEAKQPIKTTGSFETVGQLFKALPSFFPSELWDGAEIIITKYVEEKINGDATVRVYYSIPVGAENVEVFLGVMSEMSEIIRNHLRIINSLEEMVEVYGNVDDAVRIVEEYWHGVF